MLFTERSIWTMVHGIALGGGALLALSAVLVSLYLLRPWDGSIAQGYRHARTVGILAVLTAALLWGTSIIGTLSVFPPYRATPPEGTTDLTAYPRSLVLSNPDTAWLHAFAMETKEHLPWIATILATAVAFIAWRARSRMLRDAHLRRMSMVLLTITFIIVAYVSLLGVFVNKVAPVY